MKGNLLVGVGAAIVATAASVGAGAQSVRPPRPVPDRIVPIPATATVLGRVTTADTGAPVRGAEVRLRATDGRENRLVTTDAEGRYAIRSLTAGEWSLTASKAGFISQQFGQTRPLEAPANIRLEPNQQVTANLRLMRAGAISGRVYDEFGDPVAGAKVQVLRTRFVRGRRTAVPVGVGDQTDDTGAFRLYALGPGDYYVGASLRTAPAENTIIDSVATPSTYFPGTPSLSEATRIALGPGEEQSNVSFTIQPVRAVRVSGVLLTASGAPATEGSFINLFGGDVNLNGMPLGNAGVIRAGGAFTITNVAPGSYLLQATTIPRESGMENMEHASMPITVGAEDLNGLTVTMTPSASVTGTVTADGGSLPAKFTYSANARSVGPSSMQMGTLARDNPTFRLAGLFGPTVIAVENLPDGWMLKSIDLNGQDVTDTPFDFRGQQNLTVRVVVTDRVTELNGIAMRERRPAPRASVVVFPEDSTKWAFPSRYLQAAQADDEGRFKFRALPPDNRYLVAAMDFLEEGEFQDPDFLERMRQRASSVAIDFGDRRMLDLEIIER